MSPDSGEPIETTSEWRGRVSAKIVDFGRRLKDHDIDIRELRAGQQTTAVEVVRLSGEVRGMREDLHQAVQDISSSRKEEVEELREAVASRTVTMRDKVLFILVPLMASALASLLVYVLTKR